jgi:hypothetical protein
MGILGWIFKRLVLMIVALGVLLFFFQGLFVKGALNITARLKSNARISVEHVDSRIERGYIRLSGVKLFNPKEFREKELAEIALIEIEFKPLSFIGGDFKITRFFIDIDKIYIIKQEKEGINLVKVKKRGSSNKKAKFNYIVEDLRVRVSSLVYKDLTRRPPKMKNIFLGLEQKYRNVEDLKKVLDAILTQKVLKSAYSNI